MSKLLVALALAIKWVGDHKQPTIIGPDYSVAYNWNTLTLQLEKKDLEFIRDTCNRTLVKLQWNGRVGLGVRCLVWIEPTPKQPISMRQSAAM